MRVIVLLNVFDTRTNEDNTCRFMQNGEIITINIIIFIVEHTHTHIFAHITDTTHSHTTQPIHAMPAYKDKLRV